MDNELNDKINSHIIYYKNSDPDLTWNTIADLVGDELDVELTGNACRKRYARNYTPGEQITAQITQIMSQEKLDAVESDVVEMLRNQFGISSDFVPRKIKTTSTDDKTWYGAEWVREQVNENKLELILEQIKAHSPNYSKFTPLNKDGKHLLVPILFDAHINKLLLDTQMSYKVLCNWIVEKAIGMNYDIGKVLLVIGNDFGNIDNVHKNTTAGTPQDTAMHWANDIDFRCECAVHAIETFSSIAPVHVIMVAGNHDRYSNQWLGKVLEAWFKDHPHVMVDNNGTSPRKYFAWGANMWGFSHGNEENSQMYPALMATEQPLMYAHSTYREMFVGHFHQKRSAYYPLNENVGVTVRWMPALSGPDDWHKLKGYIGAKQQALGIIYNTDGYDCEFAINAR